MSLITPDLMDATSVSCIRLGAMIETVAGVLLAAGEGSRLGQPKALVSLDGQTLAERGTGLLRAGGAEPGPGRDRRRTG